MAVGDYNSPYTGQQLDDTIRKISSNNIHTYVKVYDNPAGTDSPILINSLPVGPNGLRTGVYDITHGLTSHPDSVQSARIIVSNLNETSSSVSRVAGSMSGADLLLQITKVSYSGTGFTFNAGKQDLNITQDSVAYQTAAIYEIWRQDTIA